VSQPHPGAATIFVNEFNTPTLEGALNHVQGGPARLVCPGFDLANGDDAHTGMFGQLPLAPVQ
jgi:hypothetical protein